MVDEISKNTFQVGQKFKKGPSLVQCFLQKVATLPNFGHEKLAMLPKFDHGNRAMFRNRVFGTGQFCIALFSRTQFRSVALFLWPNSGSVASLSCPKLGNIATF